VTALERARAALDRAREHAAREFESSATDDLIEAIDALLAVFEPARKAEPHMRACSFCGARGDAAELCACRRPRD
jgi:hypothetical protein